jgi:hypothetical protein
VNGQWWSWALAAVGVFGLWLTTRRDWRGYLVGVSVQLLWVAYAIATTQWGFIASALVYGAVNMIGIRAWRNPKPHPLTYRDGSWRCMLCRTRVPAGMPCDGTERYS